MLYEMYLPKYAENYKKEIDVKNQKVCFKTDTNKEIELSDADLHYKIKGLDEVILLNKPYRLEREHNEQVLELFKDSLHLLGYELGDILVTVRYVLSDFQLIEQLYVYSLSQRVYLPVSELTRVVEKQREPLIKDNRLNPDLVRDLLMITINNEEESTGFERPIPLLDESFIKYIKSKELDVTGYHNGESAYNEDLVWNINPSARTGLLYNVNDSNELELFHVGKHWKIPPYSNAEFREIDSRFINKNRLSLAILFFYPKVTGYKFYHKDGTLLISLYSGKEKIKDLQDIALTYSHYLLEQNSVTV